MHHALRPQSLELQFLSLPARRVKDLTMGLHDAVHRQHHFFLVVHHDGRSHPVRQFGKRRIAALRQLA